MVEEPGGMMAALAIGSVALLAFGVLGPILLGLVALAAVIGIIWGIVHLVRKATGERRATQGLQARTERKIDGIHQSARDARMEINNITGESWRNQFE